MSNIELLIEEIKTLSADHIEKVLDFVEFIKQKETCVAKERDGLWFEIGEECPICVKHCDPKTGEPHFNAETIAAIEEGRAIMSGEIPAQRFKSLDELLADLRS